MSDIGTYSTSDCGLINDEDDNVTGTKVYFEIKVAENCPNDYTGTFNLNVTYENGMDEHDHNIYSLCDEFKLSISNGYVLPNVINEDTTFTNNKLYIVQNDVLIPEGVTVTFEEGCNIQFYVDVKEYIDSIYNSPMIKTYGKLFFKGSEDEFIKIHPSESHNGFGCIIFTAENGEVEFNFCEIDNMVTNASQILSGTGSQNIYIRHSNLNYSGNRKIVFYFKGNTLLPYSRLNLKEMTYSKITFTKIESFTLELGYKMSNCLYYSYYSSEAFELIYSQTVQIENNLFILGKSIPDYDVTNNFLDFEKCFQVYLCNNVFSSLQLCNSLTGLKEIKLPKNSTKTLKYSLFIKNKDKCKL